MTTQRQSKPAPPRDRCVPCFHCGYPNLLDGPPGPEGLHCEECNERLPDPFTARGRFRLWAQAHWVSAWLLMSLPVGAALGGYALHGQAKLDQARLHLEMTMSRGEAQHQAELAAIRQAHAAELRRTESNVVAEVRRQTGAWLALRDNPDLVSGKLARDRHADEWAKRLAHDPALAFTPAEKLLLDIERVGRDPQLAGREALEAVLRLVAPEGSTNQIVAEGDQFRVELAFKMSALSPNVQGAWTKHESVEALKQETILRCAQVMRDLFDSCGWRGLRQLRISCNHAVLTADDPPGETNPPAGTTAPGAPAEWQVLYRCAIAEPTISRIASWRLLPLHKVADLMTVELDGFPQIRLRTGWQDTRAQAEPAGPLKF